MDEYDMVCSCLDCPKLELGSYYYLDQGFQFQCGITSKCGHSSVEKLLPPTNQHNISLQL